MALTAGIMKVWNEIEIMEDTLVHFSDLCDHMFIYDDCSDDGTYELLKDWKGGNLTVVQGDERHESRPAAQGGLLNVILGHAKVMKPDWIIQIDADERVEWNDFDIERLDAITFRLFDFYITKEDEYDDYITRRWMGPEYRDILMMYRAFPGMTYGWRDQREMWGLPPGYRRGSRGYVRHYGKAISVERWERQCDYYADNFPEPYKSKWAARRGKAVHDGVSDFGRPLIEWYQRYSHGVAI